MDESKLILQKLDDIKSELSHIKERIHDIDCVLTDDDLESLKKADEELRKGKTKRLG